MRISRSVAVVTTITCCLTLGSCLPAGRMEAGPTTAPGVHTDEQLFEWISDGFPGSAMPAWRKNLSDTDRWNLVNFIRTMAPKTQ